MNSYMTHKPKIFTNLCKKKSADAFLNQPYMSLKENDRKNIYTYTYFKYE